MEVILDKNAIDKLSKPINGIGGAQDLLRKLQRQMVVQLTYDDNDLIKIRNYANHNNGNGGFQGRFKAILNCIEQNN